MQDSTNDFWRDWWDPTWDLRWDPTWEGCGILPMISGGNGRIPPGI